MDVPILNIFSSPILTVTTVSNTGETGDINAAIKHFLIPNTLFSFQGSDLVISHFPPSFYVVLYSLIYSITIDMDFIDSLQISAKWGPDSKFVVEAIT